MNLTHPVSVLFAREGNAYEALGCDVYTRKRDARTWHGNGPVIAHPPCGTWGRLRGQAAVNDEERALSPWALDAVRRVGGVLEHPAASSLWHYGACMPPGKVDEFGGFLLPVDQSWWGHQARKRTWLYVVGCARRDVPMLPFSLDLPPRRVEMLGRGKRELTPPAMAEWLVELAGRCVR